MNKTVVFFLCLFSSPLLFGQLGIYSGTEGKDSVFLFLWEREDPDMDQPTIHGEYYDREANTLYLMKGWERDDEIVLQEYPLDPERPILTLTIEGNTLHGTVFREEEETLLKMERRYDEQTELEGHQLFITLCTSALQFKKTDALFSDAGVTLRSYRESLLGFPLFRVESGLPDEQLKWTNQQLEDLHRELYISGTFYRSQTDSVAFFATDPFFTAGLLSFTVGIHDFEDWGEDGFQVTKIVFSIIIDVQQQKFLHMNDILTEKAFEIDASQPYRELTYWQALLKAYFRKTHPQEAKNCDNVINHEWAPEKSTLLLTKKGFRILNDLHYNESCFNPEWAVIPYPEAKALINPEIYSRLLTIKP